MQPFNYLTIDFEDWYQGLTSTSKRPEQWGQYEKRLPVSSQWLLDTLAARNVRATFFVVGVVAREHPQLVRRIAQAGHEIGLHGDHHQRIDHMTRAQFRNNVKANFEAVRAASGILPKGFRAPCFSVGPSTTWLWEELSAQGLAFDSSILPIRTPLYGLPHGPREPFNVATPSGNLKVLPITTVRMFGVNVPFSGGFYFRALPYAVVRALTRRINAAGKPVLFYFHPWEFDADHPRPAGITLRERLSHYGWLMGARRKFERLLADFRFRPLGTAVG